MSELLSASMACSPVISLAAFGFAYWYFFVFSSQWELGKVAKR